MTKIRCEKCNGTGLVTKSILFGCWNRTSHCDKCDGYGEYKKSEPRFKCKAVHYLQNTKACKQLNRIGWELCDKHLEQWWNEK
jgi:DnaJ-class molecular chaperone